MNFIYGVKCAFKSFENQINLKKQKVAQLKAVSNLIPTVENKLFIYSQQHGVLIMLMQCDGFEHGMGYVYFNLSTNNRQPPTPIRD